jgi:hypothetical protein
MVREDSILEELPQEKVYDLRERVLLFLILKMHS